MKTILTSLFILLSYFGMGQLPTVDIRSLKSNDKLEISLDSDGNFNELLSSIVFTVKWDNTTGNISEFNSITPLIISPSGDPIVEGSYTHQVFVGFGFNHMSSMGISLDPDTNLYIGYFTIDEDGSYSIINDNTTELINGNYYISLNGEDRTGLIHNEIDISTKINENNFKSNILYPNPFTNSFEIISNEPPKLLKLIDISGKIIKEISFSNEKLIFDTSDILPGSYLIKIIYDDKILITKGIKIN